MTMTFLPFRSRKRGFVDIADCSVCHKIEEHLCLCSWDPVPYIDYSAIPRESARNLDAQIGVDKPVTQGFHDFLWNVIMECHQR